MHQHLDSTNSSSSSAAAALSDPHYVHSGPGTSLHSGCVVLVGRAGEAIDKAVQLYLQRAPAAGSLQLRTPRTTNSNPQAQGSGSSSSSSGDALMFRLAERLSAATQPLYLQLLLPVSQHKAGIQFLVNLRADLLGLLKEQPAAAVGQQGAALRALDQDLR